MDCRRLPGARPLRVLVPIHSFEPSGVERVALRLAAEWQSAGHDVQIVVGRDEGREVTRPPELTYEILAGRTGALAEALVAGLPVVATDCSAAIDDILDHGALRHIVPVGDEAAFAFAMAKHAPPAQADRFLRHLRRFSVERSAERYIELFARLVRSGRRIPSLAARMRNAGQPE